MTRIQDPAIFHRKITRIRQFFTLQTLGGKLWFLGSQTPLVASTSTQCRRSSLPKTCIKSSKEDLQQLSVALVNGYMAIKMKGSPTCSSCALPNTIFCGITTRTWPLLQVPFGMAGCTSYNQEMLTHSQGQVGLTLLGGFNPFQNICSSLDHPNIGENSSRNLWNQRWDCPMWRVWVITKKKKNRCCVSTSQHATGKMNQKIISKSGMFHPVLVCRYSCHGFQPSSRSQTI